MLIFDLISRIRRRSVREFRLFLWKINGKIRRSVTIPTNQGTFTVFCHDNFIGKSLYYLGEYELDLMLKTITLLQSLQKIPSKGEGTLLDIGANMGVISIGMIHRGLVKKAIAIEPEPRNFSLLQHNIRQNGLEDKMICLPYAVSDKNGIIQFELSDTNLGDHRVRADMFITSLDELYQESDRRVIEVESEQLDNLVVKLPKSFTEDIALVWIDVQGYEGYVFLGGSDLLSKGMPVVAEIWPYGIERAGMSQKQFCEIAESIWSSYWVMRKDKFIRYPISVLATLFDELGYDGSSNNVIFTRE